MHFSNLGFLTNPAIAVSKQGLGFAAGAMLTDQLYLRRWFFRCERSADSGGLRHVFYRFQVTQFLAVTPDVQLIAEPALNPNEDFLALLGLRLRAAF